MCAIIGTHYLLGESKLVPRSPLFLLLPHFYDLTKLGVSLYFLKLKKTGEKGTNKTKGTKKKIENKAKNLTIKDRIMGQRVEKDNRKMEAKATKRAKKAQKGY